jgi:nucleotide-binding universal stress UspA family protein
MFHRILVALDGSQRAEQALPIATRLARASHGTLVLVRAVSSLAVLALSPDTMMAYQRASEAELEEAKVYLKYVANLNSIAGIHVESRVIEDHAAAAILSVAEARSVDLIVLCSHGYTGMKRWMVGSVAEKVLRHASVPVLLLHEDGPALVDVSTRTDGSVHAFIPLDGSERAKAAIFPAVQLMSALVSPGSGTLNLTLAAVLPVNKKIHAVERENIVYEAKQYLSATTEQTREEMAAILTADLKFSVTWLVTSDEDIAEGIGYLAEESQDIEEPGTKSVELIAMTTHGYSGMRRWTMGSITERVLHSTRLPVLIVRPADMMNTREDTVV